MPTIIKNAASAFLVRESSCLDGVPCKLHHKKRDETNVMSGNEKNLEIRIERGIGVAAAREKHVSSMPAISRRTFLASGTAAGASLLLGQMAEAESSGGDDGLKEYDIATNGISLHVTEQGEGPAAPAFPASWGISNSTMWGMGTTRSLCRGQ